MSYPAAVRATTDSYWSHSRHFCSDAAALPTNSTAWLTHVVSSHLWMRREFLLHRYPRGKTLEETANESKCRAGEKFPLKSSFKRAMFRTKRACCQWKDPQQDAVSRSHARSLFHLPRFPTPAPTSRIQPSWVTAAWRSATGKQGPAGEGTGARGAWITVLLKFSLNHLSTPMFIPLKY